MKISNERLEQIRNFKNSDFSDCPILTAEQLSKMKPCHIVQRHLQKNKADKAASKPAPTSQVFAAATS